MPLEAWLTIETHKVDMAVSHLFVSVVLLYPVQRTGYALVTSIP